MKGSIFKRGSVGLRSRSGTLTYEAVYQTTVTGLGRTSAVDIGGDPVKDTEFIAILALLLANPENPSTIMIGEICSAAEEEAAQFLQFEAKQGRSKPNVAFIAGRTSPTMRKMGHADALISARRGGAEDKVEALRSDDIHASPSAAKLGETILDLLAR